MLKLLAVKIEAEKFYWRIASFHCKETIGISPKIFFWTRCAICSIQFCKMTGSPMRIVSGKCKKFGWNIIFVIFEIQYLWYFKYNTFDIWYIIFLIFEIQYFWYFKFNIFDIWNTIFVIFEIQCLWYLKYNFCDICDCILCTHWMMFQLDCSLKVC